MKPIVSTFERELDRSQKYTTVNVKWDVKSPEKLALFTVHKYYFDFEKLNALLDDRERFDKDETRFVLEAVPPDTSYFRGFESSLLDLISMMRQEIATMLDPLRWPGKTDHIEFIKKAHETSFHPSTKWRDAKLGIAHIQEGHARFLEMQLIASLCADRNDFGFFVNNGYWGDRYTLAYKAFLEWSNLSPPSTVLDWRVHLFILVCEYALNPTAPYLDGFELDGLFDHFHPANRFKTASLALRKLPSLAPGGPTNGKFMKDAFDAIEQASSPKWAMSLAEALRTVERCEPCVRHRSFELCPTLFPIPSAAERVAIQVVL